MSKLHFTNIILQWFFIRLTKVKTSNYKGSNYGNYGGENWYSIQYWVLPLTGWRNGMRFINGQKFKRITPKRCNFSNRILW